jgi:hypothetical protein
MLTGRLLIPVWDQTGRFVYWIARDTTGRSAVKVLNMPTDDKHEAWGLERVPECASRNEVLVGLHLLRTGVPAYLVEGPMDAIVCGSGFVASMGSKLSVEQAHLIASVKPSSVTVIYDGDDAGRRGSDQAQALLSSFLPTRVAHCPWGKDPADLGRTACLELSSNAHGQQHVLGLVKP